MYGQLHVTFYTCSLILALNNALERRALQSQKCIVWCAVLYKNKKNENLIVELNGNIIIDLNYRRNLKQPTSTNTLNTVLQLSNFIIILS
jgi:hypothetical protein